MSEENVNKLDFLDTMALLSLIIAIAGFFSGYLFHSVIWWLTGLCLIVIVIAVNIIYFICVNWGVKMSEGKLDVEIVAVGKSVFAVREDGATIDIRNNKGFVDALKRNFEKYN